MITAGPGLRVIHSGSSYVQPGAVGAGMVRWNPNYNCLETWDGNAWTALTTYQMDLDPEVMEILGWARSRMEEDRRLAELCEKHPGLKEAHERLEIMRQLVKQEAA